jgi:hypothetical protein
MMSAWTILLEAFPVMAMAAAITLIPLCGDRPWNDRSNV